MALSKPGMMSAFLCPGMGQFAAGKRVLGAAIVLFTITVVMSPFARFFWAVLRPPPCDPFANGIWGCNKFVLGAAWGVTWPVIEIAFPIFAVTYASAVWHANGLTIVEKTGKPATE